LVVTVDDDEIEKNTVRFDTNTPNGATSYDIFFWIPPFGPTGDYNKW
jgi:hypothetical protein